MTGPVFIGPVTAAPAAPGYGACSADAGCITCGDVAVPLTVVRTAAGGTDALCRDDQGREETVATELVGPVAAGDRLLVHAGVALEVIDTGGRASASPADGATQTGDRDAVRR